MPKKKDPQIFERITDKQETFIHVLCNESIDFDQAEFDTQLLISAQKAVGKLMKLRQLKYAA